MQQSSSPAPLTTPTKAERKLAPVQAPPKPSKKGYVWFAVFLAICAGAYWLYQKNLAEDALAARRAATAVVRSAPVAAGIVSRTLRLTGTTGPEKFVTIMGPQLRGSRSFGGGGGAFMGRSGGGGGGGSRGGGGGSSQASVSSSGSGGSDSSRSSSSTVSSSSSAASGGLSAGSGSMGMSGGSGASGGGGVRSSQGAMRAATSRSSSGGSSRSALSSGASAAAASASMGAEGLGSTSSNLQGGGGGSPGGGGPGGGGGGSGDFGSILQQLAKAGGTVKKGDMLAEFDRQNMILRMDDYKSGVNQQELNMSKMVANLEVTRKAHEQSIQIAKGDVERAELDLKTSPVRSDMEKERFKLALEEANAKYKQLLEEIPFVRAGEESQVKISEMDLQQSKIELRRAEANADRMMMKSPINGLVVMLNIFTGGDFRPVKEGDPVMAGMPFMRVVDPSSMIINAFVNQADVERMRVGAKARIRVDAFPDLELPGHVYSVAAMPRSSGSSARASFLKEIPVTVKLDKMDPRVIPDLSVSVDVIIEEEQAAAVAPLAAVFRDADAKPYVYVKSATGWDKRTVELGLADNVHISIKSGLRSGETVAEEKPPLPEAANSTARLNPDSRQVDVWRRRVATNSSIG